MRIQLASDLHHEFGLFPIDYDDIDVLAIAGDLNVGLKGVEWLKENIKNIPVIYILGNHEYYHGSYPKTLNKILACAACSNIHVLENKSLTIDHVTFHGATLWTDFSLFGSPVLDGALCEQQMNDCKLIRVDPFYTKLRPKKISKIHDESLHWLDQSLTASHTDVNIVITHHAPSIQSIPEGLKNVFIASAYASDLEYLVEKHQPDFWLHGHVHHPSDYTIGKTTVICNPFGYDDEQSAGFDPKLIIEV